MITLKYEAFPVKRLGGSGGWYVFWEAIDAYGSMGDAMTESEAHNLADKINSGEVTP